MAHENPEDPTRFLHRASGLGTSAARLAERLRSAQEPPPSLPHGPFSGRLASHLADAMVETAARVDSDTVKALQLVPRPPLRIRRVRYPFESRISLYEQRAQDHSMEWLVAHGLLADAAAIDRFERSRFGTLAARTTPDATELGLDWLADWGVWLFAFDDTYCDEASLGLHPGRLVRRIVSLMRVLDHPAEPVAHDDRFAGALADLRDRFAELGDAERWGRFTAATRAYFLGIVWEAGHRESGQSPTVADYAPMRAHSGAAWTFLAINDALCGYELPSRSYYAPGVVRLGSIAMNLICWSNDLYSYGRESTSQESSVVLNLVAVIAAERRCDTQTALDETRRMHDDELAAYRALEPIVRSGAASELRRYIGGVGSWVAGNEEWSFSTARYRAGEHLVIDE